MTFHTAGFWGATSADMIWALLIREWFPTQEDLDRLDLEHAFRCFARGVDVGNVQENFMGNPGTYSSSLPG
jgi:hypothetical protein